MTGFELFKALAMLPTSTLLKPVVVYMPGGDEWPIESLELSEGDGVGGMPIVYAVTLNVVYEAWEEDNK